MYNVSFKVKVAKIDLLQRAGICLSQALQILWLDFIEVVEENELQIITF